LEKNRALGARVKKSKPPTDFQKAKRRPKPLLVPTRTRPTRPIHKSRGKPEKWKPIPGKKKKGPRENEKKRGAKPLSLYQAEKRRSVERR